MAKIGEKAYDSILDKPTLTSALQQFYEKEYKEAKQIRDLHSEETWTMLKNFGERDLREIVMLRRAFNQMKMIFYGILNAYKADGFQETAPGSSAELQDG